MFLLIAVLFVSTVLHLNTTVKVDTSLMIFCNRNELILPCLRKEKLHNPSEGLTAGHKAIGNMSSAKNDAVLFGALLRPISAMFK